MQTLVDHLRGLSDDGLAALIRLRPDLVVPVPSDLPALAARVQSGPSVRRALDALDMFVEAYGAETGNIALRYMATAGIYIGGGIAPKIMPAIEAGGFMRAFLDKDPLVDLLRTFPVKIILNPAAGMLGAAVTAAEG